MISNRTYRTLIKLNFSSINNKNIGQKSEVFGHIVAFAFLWATRLEYWSTLESPTSGTLHLGKVVISCVPLFE